MASGSEYNSVMVFGRHYRTPIDFAGFREAGEQNIGTSVELLLWSKEELAERYGVKNWDKMGDLLDPAGFKRTWGTISGVLRRMHIFGEGLYVLDEQAKRIVFVRSAEKENVDYCPWDTNLVACLGVYEQLQGHIVLHAQVVEWQESAIAIIGKSGMGKSSMSLAAIAQGARILSDDVGVFFVSSRGVFAIPGVAAVRTYRDSLTGTGQSYHVREGGSSSAKVCVCAEDNPWAFSNKVREVQAIVSLDRSASDDSPILMDTLSGNEAMVSCLSNMYGLFMARDNEQAHMLKMTATMTEAVRVVCLKYPSNWDLLPEAAARILSLAE